MKDIILYERIMRGVGMTTILFYWSVFVATPALIIIYFLVMNLLATVSNLLPILS